MMATANQGRLSGWLFPMIAAGVLAASVTGLAVQQAQADDAAASRSAEVLELTERLTGLSQSRADAAEGAAALSAGAPSSEVDAALERIEADRERVGELLKTVFVWDSTGTYEEARYELAKEYGIPAESALMTTFMPPAPVERDDEGNEYPYIEASGLNSSLGAFTAKLMSVQGTDYTYVVNASAQTSSTDGSTAASRGVVLIVTTTAEGGFTDVQAWASPAAARTTG